MKSANVLLDNDGNVKLSDFGISMQTNKLKENQNMKGVFGTYGYMSPEAADPKKPMCKSSDIYSLGCIMIEMITGRVPFSDLEADPLASCARSQKVQSSPNWTKFGGALSARKKNLWLGQSCC